MGLRPGVERWALCAGGLREIEADFECLIGSDSDDGVAKGTVDIDDI